MKNTQNSHLAVLYSKITTNKEGLCILKQYADQSPAKKISIIRSLMKLHRRALGQVFYQFGLNTNEEYENLMWRAYQQLDKSCMPRTDVRAWFCTLARHESLMIRHMKKNLYLRADVLDIT